LHRSGEWKLFVGKLIPDKPDKQYNRHTYEAGKEPVKDCIQNHEKDGIVGGSAVEIVESSKNAEGSAGKSDERSRRALKNPLYPGICETIRKIGESFR
jgi:hypothetical protein